MFGFGRKRQEDDRDEDGFDLDGYASAREERETQIIEDVCAAIDVINELIPQLPRGVYPWMQWRPTPRLTLVASTPPERTVLHGDGLARVRFD